MRTRPVTPPPLPGNSISNDVPAASARSRWTNAPPRDTFVTRNWADRPGRPQPLRPEASPTRGRYCRNRPKRRDSPYRPRRRSRQHASSPARRRQIAPEIACTLAATSRVVALRYSMAAEMAAMMPPTPFIAVTTSAAALRTISIWSPISVAALAVCPASRLHLGSDHRKALAGLAGTGSSARRCC
jgi:hypothetical protein